MTLRITCIKVPNSFDGRRRGRETKGDFMTNLVHALRSSVNLVCQFHEVTQPLFSLTSFVFCVLASVPALEHYVFF